MEVYEAMRTAFAARQYTQDTVSDEVVYRILDNARFAPSGGNRQGWRVLVVRDRDLRTKIRETLAPTIKQYKTQAKMGETPFSTIEQTSVSQADIDRMSADFPLVDDLEHAPVLLVVCIDLSLVSAMDKDLDRVGVISGASIYPFAWNILLSARNEGLGGVLTTFLANQEPTAKTLLSVPDSWAIAAMIGIGKPAKQLTKLNRKPVEEFTWVDTFAGEHFGG